MPGARPVADLPSGLILAGGQSRRMGGSDKARAPLAGKPLLQHVIERMTPQVAGLALSVERVSPALAGFGLPQLADERPGHRGPLQGLLAGLRHFADRADWVLIAPCDAPFLPADLGAGLLACAAQAGAPAACVRWQGELQPTFCVIHVGLLTRLEQAVTSGDAALKPFLRAAAAAHCDWPATTAPGEAPPFFNINDPAALEQARGWLPGGRVAEAC